MSRRSHDLPGSAGKRHAGQRAAGENESEMPKVARPRNASVLAYSRRYDLFSLESWMLGNGPVQFGKGATEKGHRYLAGALLHLEGGKGREALPILTPSDFVQ